MTADDRIQLRHPDPTKMNARIASDAYAVAHRTVLAVVPRSEPGITLPAYLDEMASQLPMAEGWDPSLSPRWYAMAMKLDLEARGELRRINARPPQRLVRTRPEQEVPVTAPENVYQVEIATTPERLWKALTDPQETRKYWHGALSISDWQVGSAWTSESADGDVYLEGEILEIDPPRRLVHSFRIVHKPEAAAEAPSRIEFEITQVGDRCRLTLTHTGRGPATLEYTSGGWETILGGLKELLETGQVVRAAM